MNNILLIGGPGSGKGTLGKYLAQQSGIHLSTGELFRYHMENDTPLGLEVKEVINAGGLADDSVTYDMMEEEITKLYAAVDESDSLYFPNLSVSLIFDGFPRTLEQGPMLDDLLSKFNRKLDVVFFLDVPDRVLLQRMQERARIENRAGDDDPDYCKKRIEVYNSRTAPLLDFYHERGILVKIDGTKSIEEVREQVMTILLSNIYDNFANSSYGSEQGNRSK